MGSKDLCSTENVVRHANKFQMDEYGNATFEAFMLDDPTKETELSVCRLNSSVFDKEQQLEEVRLLLGQFREMKRSHGLAELNVGKSIGIVFAECSIRIRFIDDPIPANPPAPANPLHAIIQLPVDNCPDPEDAAELIAVWIAESIIETHPARLD